MGTINGARNDLSKILLVACDLSYSGDNPKGQPGQPLDSFPDSGSSEDPTNAAMPTDWSPLLEGWTVLQRTDVAQTGFGYTVFSTNSDGKIDYIVAMQGTRGPNRQDWSGNLIYGWDKWTNPLQGGTQLIATLVALATKTDEGEIAGSIHFTGQSLGGALAEYALYDFAIALNAAAEAHLTNTIEEFDPTKVTLTTFNGLGGIEALQKDLTRNFNANVGLFTNVDTAHFWITNDVVHRLGAGHLNGAENEYELKFSKTDPAGNILRRSDGTPIYMDGADAHRIESGFYRGFYNAKLGGFIGDSVINGFPIDFTEAALKEVDIFHLQNLARAGTYFAWLSNQDWRVEQRFDYSNTGFGATIYQKRNGDDS